MDFLCVQFQFTTKPDINLYNKIRNMVFENKDKFIIVAGDWKPSNLGYGYFETKIYSDRQISILN